MHTLRCVGAAVSASRSLQRMQNVQRCAQGMQSEHQGVRSVAAEVYIGAAVSIEASMGNAETASRGRGLQGAGVPGQ